MPYKIDSQNRISLMIRTRFFDFYYQFYSKNVPKLGILTKSSEIYITKFQSIPKHAILY